MTDSTTIYDSQEASNLSPAPIVYGGFWERFAALIIDAVILWVIGYMIGILFDAPSADEIIAISQSEGFASAVSSSYFSTSNKMSFLAQWLYFALMHSSPWQATLGKRALGLKVTGLKGQRITFINATGRYFATFISVIILFIGYLMMLWDDKKQTLHDRLAHTLVVKA